MDSSQRSKPPVREIVAILLLSGVALRCTSEGTDARRIPSAGEQAAADLLQVQVEQLVEETGVPGMAVAVVEGEGPLLVAAAGFEDLEREIPVKPNTPFLIGSISKNVFAAITLQLADEGLLALDSPLSDYLEWPRGDEVTVRMLLNHTSGIPEYLSALARSGPDGGVPEFFQEPRPPSEIIRMLPSREPEFDPGTFQAYSNTNGLLVGMVIERATGKTLSQNLEERIVAPLGLEDTYLYEESTIDWHRARGYCSWPGWIEEPGRIRDCTFADEALPNSADGSIVSTAGDLLRYHQALRSGELLSQVSWEAMRSVEPGLDNGLGYLIMTGPQGDHQGNVGRAMGHLAANIYYVERDLFVVMMLNQGDAQLPMARFLELRYGSE